MGHASERTQSPNNAPWDTLNQRLTTPISAYPWHWSGYLQGTCIPLTLLRIPAVNLHTPDTARDTCRAPTYPRHSSGYQRRRIGQTPKALTCSYYVGIRWLLAVTSGFLPFLEGFIDRYTGTWYLNLPMHNGYIGPTVRANCFGIPFAS